MDAEGSFIIFVLKETRNQIGWQVRGFFEIGLDNKDIALLKEIQLFFGVGKIYEYGSMAYYKVTSIKDLAVIIDHFDKYPLITQKRADYELFKMVILLISQKEHFTIEGLKKIVAIKASLNLGLSAELKAAFPEVIPVPRPLIESTEVKALRPY